MFYNFIHEIASLSSCPFHKITDHYFAANEYFLKELYTYYNIYFTMYYNT